jgi:hypothetical protein
MTHSPYGQQHYASKPTKTTLFFRTFLPWQLFRLLVVNLRMTMMILKSHDRTIGPPALPPGRTIERKQLVQAWR